MMLIQSNSVRWVNQTKFKYMLLFIFVGLYCPPCNAVAATTAIPIPCNVSNLQFTVQSNASYVLANCVVLPSDNVDPFLLLTPSSTQADVVQNIHIDVVGGNVLPCLSIAAPTQLVKNMTVIVRSVYVVAPLSSRILDEAIHPKVIVSTLNAREVRNVTVVVESSVINITTAGSLLLLMDNSTARGTDVVVVNSTIVLTCAGALPYYSVGLVGLLLLDDSVDIRVVFAQSTASVGMNASAVTVSQSPMAVLWVVCSTWATCGVDGVNFSSSQGSSLAVTCTSDGNRGRNFSSNIVLAVGILRLRNLNVWLASNTSITSRCVCTHSCGSQSSGSIGDYLSSNVLQVSGVQWASMAQFVTFIAEGVAFVVNAPRYAAVVRCVGMLQLDFLNVSIAACVAAIVTQGQDIGTASSLLDW